MDDEKALRDISMKMLKNLGHQVEVASQGAEALEKYRNALSAGRRFDVVILDLTIRGGMGGEETMKNLLLMDPTVNAIVSSGYSDGASLSEFEANGFKACLPKPYTMNSLNRALNSIMEEAT